MAQLSLWNEVPRWKDLWEFSKQFPDNILRLLATDRQCIVHTYSKAKVPVSMQFTKYLQIIEVAKINVFDPVMQ